MSPDARWPQVAALFERALELLPGERSGWLLEACADDDLRREVEGLVRAHERSAGVLDRSVGPLAARAVAEAAERAPPARPPVRRVGPYEVVREIGRGGMGVVYEAWDPRLRRPVALKCLTTHAELGAGARARFLAEARTLAGLDHPGICTVHDVVEAEDGRLYLGMAYYEGQTLAERLRAGPLPAAEALATAAQLLDALECAHGAGVVHRDVKPSNVLLADRGRVKLLDFGVAKLTAGAPMTAPGVRVGTLAYMAPEQVDGGAVDARADVWAAGVVLYEMLAGRRPFEADTDAALLRAIVDREPAPVRAWNRDLPAALDQVLRTALAKRPNDRYASAAAFSAALGAAGPPGSPNALPAPAAPAPPPGGGLPAPLTRFVGREREVAGVRALLGAARLVTLTGPGGTGKTRLALRAAGELAGEFRDGAHFVALGAITDAAVVPAAIAGALGVVDGAVRPAAAGLAEALRARHVLLVLDNFEQVAAAAPAVRAVLEAAPDVKVLVTSRVPLRVDGEHEFAVPPLDLPRTGETALGDLACAPAVELFVDRARAVRSDFALTAANVQSVADLCRRLDGLPLAIELAAARVKLFAPQALLARLSGRLDLLRADGVDRPPRHRTLRHAIEWSYDLLNDGAREAFRRLAVFAGGWTLEGAEAVLSPDGAAGADVVDRIATLVDHSLVGRDDGPDGEPRFRMLETVREFAADCLRERGEEESARRAHASYALALAERAEPHLTGRGQAAWLERLHAEHDNVRAALAWALAREDAALALRLAAALWRFWTVRNHFEEGLGWIERAGAQRGG